MKRDDHGRREMLALLAASGALSAAPAQTPQPARRRPPARRYDMKKSINLWAFPYPRQRQNTSKAAMPGSTPHRSGQCIFRTKSRLVSRSFLFWVAGMTTIRHTATNSGRVRAHGIS